jgi:hypothetical protein
MLTGARGSSALWHFGASVPRTGAREVVVVATIPSTSSWCLLVKSGSTSREQKDTSTMTYTKLFFLASKYQARAGQFSTTGYLKLYTKLGDSSAAPN